MKKLLLFLVLFAGVANAMQSGTTPAEDVAGPKPLQELVRTNAIEQQSEESNLPNGHVITVEVKQIGEPSLRTFYQVPVEITVTNNLDRVIGLVPPYFSDISFSQGSFLTKDIMQDIKRIAVAETKLAVGLVCVLGCGAMFFVPLYLANGWPLVLGTGFDTGLVNATLHLGAFLGAISQPAIFISNLISRNLLSTENITRILVPHKPTVIKGYISIPDMKNIQDGLNPGAVFNLDIFTK